MNNINEIEFEFDRLMNHVSYDRSIAVNTQLLIMGRAHQCIRDAYNKGVEDAKKGGIK